MNYYNEIDPYCVRWLENLMDAGHIPYGLVDSRSIKEVTPGDLDGFTQCHFFAGIAGWSLALQLAGWPEDRPVWTGSCPCQPFSAAGKRLGIADDRHLWPWFFDLIKKCKPECVFGEQVASAIGHGWLDGISADLESASYACGAVVLGAHSVGAPHIRQRLWWVAEPDFTSDNRRSPSGKQQVYNGNDAVNCGVAHPQTTNRRGETHRIQNEGAQTRRSSPWCNYEFITCFDGRARRIEPGTFPLAYGVPARMGKLRAYGNAINPYTAAEFINAWLSTSPPA